MVLEGGGESKRHLDETLYSKTRRFLIMEY